MVFKGDNIPYSELAKDLFSGSETQQIVPFLGAGVSISARGGPADSANAALEQDPRITKALACLKEPGKDHPDAQGKPRASLDDATMLYAETALEIAFVLQQIRSSAIPAADSDVLQRLIDDPYPPSAGDLVDLFSQSASFVSFDEVLSRIAKRLGRPVDGPSRDALLALLRLIAAIVGASAAPLSSISAYFEVVWRRPRLLNSLGDILLNKNRPTPTHQLIARAAAWHLNPRKRKDGAALPDGRGDYLIMTTNYDCLMETALQVPYVVLSMSMTDFFTRPRFGNMAEDVKAAFMRANPPRSANKFALARPTPNEDDADAVVKAAADLRLAIVYKIHGCIQEWKDPQNPQDTIVISDNDYVANISRFSHNDGVIPVCVSDILKGQQSKEQQGLKGQQSKRQEQPYFLFLGYSLSDWNIRGMLRAIRVKRAGEGNEEQDYGDYTVVRNFTLIDETFFTQNKIRIIHEDLKNFAPAMESKREARYGP
jgi:hypothetical protein